MTSASRAEAFVERLPPWIGSIRFRLTVLYSVVLFALAAAVVGGIYMVVARQLDEPVVFRTYVERPILTPDGVELRREVIEGEFQTLERLVNQRALDQLRTYSFGALALLFVSSLGIGWVLAGRVLAPVHRITAVARDIQATDLSRRITLRGPKDELRELADTFDQMLARLEGGFEAQRRFIQEASHELRNPLAVIRTNLDVTLDDPDSTPDDVRQSAVVVRSTIERMGRLVDDMLAAARTGLPERAWERIELAPVAAEVAAEFEAPAGARRLRLVAETAPDLSTMGDRTALKQALANLLDNAVRLAPEGSTVLVTLGERDGWAHLSVADEGPGIAPEHHETVFQRFWRGDQERAGRRGSGLGLAIVRQIAEHHGGRVALASASGRGSTFTLWLPLLPPDLPS